MSTSTLDRVGVDPTTGEPRCAHIVRDTDDKTGIQLVFEARLNGTTVEAICGHRFVPERDPKAYPLCSRCRDIREAERPDQPIDGIPS